MNQEMLEMNRFSNDNYIGTDTIEEEYWYNINSFINL